MIQVFSNSILKMFRTCGKFFLAWKFNAKFRQKVKVRFRDGNFYKKNSTISFLSHLLRWRGSQNAEFHFNKNGKTLLSSSTLSKITILKVKTSKRWLNHFVEKSLSMGKSPIYKPECWLISKNLSQSVLSSPNTSGTLHRPSG